MHAWHKHKLCHKLSVASGSLFWECASWQWCIHWWVGCCPFFGRWRCFSCIGEVRQNSACHLKLTSLSLISLWSVTWSLFDIETRLALNLCTNLVPQNVCPPWRCKAHHPQVVGLQSHVPFVMCQLLLDLFVWHQREKLPSWLLISHQVVESKANSACKQVWQYICLNWMSAHESGYKSLCWWCRLQSLCMWQPHIPFPLPLIVHRPHWTKYRWGSDPFPLGYMTKVECAHFMQPNSLEFGPAQEWRALELSIVDLKGKMLKSHEGELAKPIQCFYAQVWSCTKRLLYIAICSCICYDCVYTNVNVTTSLMAVQDAAQS